jgi:hypothetical protein
VAISGRTSTVSARRSVRPTPCFSRPMLTSK